jgi:hypothetical protein
MTNSRSRHFMHRFNFSFSTNAMKPIGFSIEILITVLTCGLDESKQRQMWRCAARAKQGMYGENDVAPVPAKPHVLTEKAVRVRWRL